MLLPRFAAWMTTLAIMVAGAVVVSAQGYPNKPIRIVTAEVAGSSDLVTRLIAQGVSGPLGQQLIVDNRPSGLIQGDIVAKASPDGYTLLVSGSVLWLAPFLRDKVLYDPVRDFSSITLAVRSPAVVIVHPSVAAMSIKELIALAKARPGELNYGSGAAGTTTHLAAELFKAMAGVNMVRINYKGSGPAFIDLIAGQLQLMFPAAAAAAPHMKSGRLRALAVTSSEPSALAPGLPTVAASGVPGYESVLIIGIFAPARTPAAITRRLNQEIVRVLNRGDVKEKLFSSGVEVVGSAPEQLAATVKSEMARMGKLIKDSGLRNE